MTPLTPSPPPFPELLLLTTMSYDMGYPFGQLGSAVPAVFPANLLHVPSLFTGGARMGENLNAVQAFFSNSPNTGVLLTSF